jgi:hypothetical protein
MAPTKVKQYHIDYMSNEKQTSKLLSASLLKLEYKLDDYSPITIRAAMTPIPASKDTK